MKKTWRLTALILAVVMLFACLTGCKKGDDTQGDTDQKGGNGSGNNGGAAQETELPEYTYTATYSKLQMEDNNMSFGEMYYANGKFYFVSSYVSGQESYDPSEGGDMGIFVNDGAIPEPEMAAASSAGVIFTEPTVVTEPVETETSGEEDTEAATAPEGDETELPVEPGGDGLAYYDVYSQGIFTMDLDGKNIQRLEAYETLPIPEGHEGSSNLQRILPTDKGIWTLENQYTWFFDLPEDWEENGEDNDKWEYYTSEEESFYLRYADLDGNVKSSVKINDLLEDENADPNDPYGGTRYIYVNNMYVDGEGNIYLFIDQRILVLDQAGNKLCQLTGEDYYSSAVQLKDGQVYTVSYSYDEAEGKQHINLLPIDLAKKDFGEPKEITAAGDLNSLFPGNEQYDFFFRQSSGFYGMDVETDTATKIFDFVNCDVDGDNLSALVPMADGRVIGVARNWDDDYSNMTMDLVDIHQVKTSELPQKTNLTYACMYLDYNVKRQILKYNRNSDKYRIVVKDYSEYNTTDDYSAGLTKLTAEILSGNVPDMFSTSGMPLSRFAARGYLEDLAPYIDGDSELKGHILPSVLKALSDDDGHLYQMAPSFNIRTVGGPTRLVGDKMGWSVDDLMAAYKQMPADASIFSMGYTRDSALSNICMMMMDDFVDWKTGECHFDNDEFIGLLKFANMFPESFDWDKIDYETDYQPDYVRFQNGQQMLSEMYLYDFLEWRTTQVYMGGEMTFIGYPTSSGNGAAFEFDTGMAMSSACGDKEGAWDFMRYFLTKDYQSGQRYIWDFPVNQEAFDERLTQAKTPQYQIDWSKGEDVPYIDPETGEKVEEAKTWVWLGDDQEEVQLYALTPEEEAKIVDLINATDRVYSYDESIYNIISEASAAFFAGQNTAENTAREIQSRVTLYVNERR